MTDALVSLPPHLRRRLEGALDTGLITTSSSPATVRSVLGLRDGGEELLENLNALERMGVSGRAAAAWLRAVEQARTRSPSPDLARLRQLGHNSLIFRRPNEVGTTTSSRSSSQRKQSVTSIWPRKFARLRDELAKSG